MRRRAEVVWGAVAIVALAVLVVLAVDALVRSWIERPPPAPAPVHPEVLRWSPLEFERDGGAPG